VGVTAEEQQWGSGWVSFAGRCRDLLGASLGLNLGGCRHGSEVGLPLCFGNVAVMGKGEGFGLVLRSSWEASQPKMPPLFTTLGIQ